MQSVILFWPKHRSDHPENYLFSLSKKMFSGSKYVKDILFYFEKRSTVCSAVVDDRCALRDLQVWSLVCIVGVDDWCALHVWMAGVASCAL